MEVVPHNSSEIIKVRFRSIEAVNELTLQKLGCRGPQFILSIEQFQGRNRAQWGPVVQKGVDVSQAGPVPARGPSQHLGETAGVVPSAVQTLVPQELVLCPFQSSGQRDGWTD